MHSLQMLLLVALLAQLERHRREKSRLQMQRCRQGWTPEKRAEVNRVQAEKACRLRRQIANAEGREIRVPSKTPEERKQRRLASYARFKKQNPERVRQTQLASKRKHRVKIEAYRRNRYHTDPQWNIMIKCRRRLWSAFDRCRSGKRSEFETITLLGCSFAQLREHVEKLFTEGMTWQHVLDGEIHLDHKKPIAKFDLTDPAQVAAAFHYSNVQPLWAVDNLIKNAKYEELIPT